MRVVKSAGWIAVAGCLIIPACDSSRRQALETLRERGIEPSGASVLHATRDGDGDTLELLLQAGAFTGQRDGRGYTPLHLAIETGDVRGAWLLIDHGADLTAWAPGEPVRVVVSAGRGESDLGTSPAHVTPLVLAVLQNEVAIADHLLDAGANPDGHTPEGEKLLPWAIRHGRSAFVQRLMKSGADPHQKDIDGNSLLHVAIQAGKRRLVGDLISLGADCGAVDNEGESAVVLAIRRGWTDLLPELARGGADLNRPDREGMAPLERAFREGDDALVEELTSLGARPAVGDLDVRLADAYRTRDRDFCRLLLRFGARPDAALIRRVAADDETGFLHLFLGYAPVPDGLLARYCLRGRTHVASLLIAHGARINPSAAPFLDTPFSIALEHGSDRLAGMLLDAGAHPGLRTAYGETPLNLALARGRADVVRRLVAHGAPVNESLRTPVPEKFTKVVRGKTMRWLLRNDSRVTPLMLAVDSGSVETARVLLEAGARTSVWTRRASVWPINLAAGHGDVRMMRLLLRKDPYVEDRRVIIDLSDQRLIVYGSTGEELLNTRVSTGKKGYSTRTGTFAITNRHRSWTSTIYHASMPYFQRLSCSDFGFHQGYVPDYPASHGCIRVPAGTAAKLFQLTDVGDRVDIVP